MLFGSEFVIKRNQHPSNLKDRVRRNQPLRLIGHDDCGTLSRIKFGVLKSTRQRGGSLLEVGIGETGALAIAIRLDQASLIRPAIEGIAERSAETCVLVEIEHSVLISPWRHPSTSLRAGSGTQGKLNSFDSWVAGKHAK